MKMLASRTQAFANLCHAVVEDACWNEGRLNEGNRQEP